VHGFAFFEVIHAAVVADGFGQGREVGAGDEDAGGHGFHGGEAAGFFPDAGVGEDVGFEERVADDVVGLEAVVGDLGMGAANVEELLEGAVAAGVAVGAEGGKDVEVYFGEVFGEFDKYGDENLEAAVGRGVVDEVEAVPPPPVVFRRGAGVRWRFL